MKLVHEQEIWEDLAFEVAKKMMIAARTAPKGKGIDNLAIAITKEDGIKEVSEKLKEMVTRDNLPDFFLRDAVNIRFLIGM